MRMSGQVGITWVLTIICSCSLILQTRWLEAMRVVIWSSQSFQRRRLRYPLWIGNHTLCHLRRHLCFDHYYKGRTIRWFLAMCFSLAHLSLKCDAISSGSTMTLASVRLWKMLQRLSKTCTFTKPSLFPTLPSTTAMEVMNALDTWPKTSTNSFVESWNQFFRILRISIWTFITGYARRF
jgi:hypothetical protein